MKKWIYSFIVFSGLAFQSKACDICGCSISNNGVGLLANYRYNTIGLRAYQNAFRQAPEFGDTKDYFRTVELFAQFHPMQRLRLSVFQPYKWHQRQTIDGNTDLQGFGDTRFLANYAIFNNLRVIGASTLYWEIGSGVKLPTGKFDATIPDQDLPENFNLGNGSWGYIAQSNLVYNTLWLGLSMNGSYQHHSISKADYRFGNQWTANGMLFLQKSLTKAWKTIPYAGIAWEKVTGDTEVSGKLAHGTTGSGTFATLGCNLVFDQWWVGTSFSTNIKQNYGDNEILARPRFALEAVHIF